MSGELEYSVRLGLPYFERTYRLKPDALEWSEPWRNSQIAFAEIERIRWYRVRKIAVAGQATAVHWHCSLHARGNANIVLRPDHSRRVDGGEDHLRSFFSFVRELITRVQASNPGVEIIYDQRRPNPGVDAAAALAATAALKLARRVSVNRAGAVAGRVARAIGPAIPEHRVGRANLSAAFPDKSADEIDAILRGVWDNLGRVGVELAQLDRICNVAPGRWSSDRIVMDDATTEHFKRYYVDRKPALFFCAHLANWEVPALVGKALDVDIAVPVRVQRHTALAAAVARARGGQDESHIPHTGDTTFKIKTALDRGACLAMPVDQHFAGGIDVNFFGRSCKANPMLARFARSLEWPIKGTRAIRLPDQRFRVEVVGPIDVARDARGRIDVAATMQIITAIVEGWVREHPDQWLWLHRRWR